MSKRRVKLLTAIATAAAAVAVVAPAAQAETPNPGYEQFAGCPSPFTENSEIATCVTTEVTGGHFQMGNKDVPIEKPFSLTGGVKEGFGPLFFNSEGGLEKVKQKVPGGVIGLTGLTWLLEFFGSEALTLYATTELAGTPILLGLGGAILPIKVHLEHSLLGKNCYVGSNSNPIVLNLTTGTTNPPPPNEPISGHEPENQIFDPVLEILRAENGLFVDNSFAAPGANGCVLTLFGFIPISINGLVNSASGLPAAAGTNETTQEFDAELVNAEFPYE